jgi:hypothetical protein
VRFNGDKSKADAVYAGCEPLTPDDIAEVVVFAAGRRENVVLADSLIFPNHQVSVHFRIASVSTNSFLQGGRDCYAQEILVWHRVTGCC